MGMCCSQSTKQKTISFNQEEPIILKEASLYQCKVRLSHSKLIQEDTDAVMTISDLLSKPLNPTTEEILQDQFIMEVFNRRRGGSSLQTQFHQTLVSEEELNYGTVIYTHGGDLGFDYIFYGMLPQNILLQIRIDNPRLYDHKNNPYSSQKYQRQYVFQCVLNTLKLSEKLCINSISLPVLPVNSRKQTGLSASVMLLGIKVFLEETQLERTNLNLINISIQDPDDINIFEWYFKRIISDGKNFNQDMLDQNDNFYMQQDVERQNQKYTDLLNDDLQNFGHSYFEPHKIKHKKLPVDSL